MWHFRHLLDGPALAVGCVVAAYWLRVLWKAMKQRLRTGRGGNFIPGEPLGRALRIIWQPVVWVWVGEPFVIAFSPVRHGLLRMVHLPELLRWAAVWGALAALAATQVCWRRMGRSWRMGIDPSERTLLITTGPFALVRHPIYTLSAGLMLCTLVATPTPLLLLAAVLHLALLWWEAVREERQLLRVHGDAFAQYCAMVGRFVPRRRRTAGVAVIIA